MISLMRTRIRLSLVLRSGLALALAGLLTPMPASAAPAATHPRSGWLQFTSGGQVVGFAPDGVLLAGGDHALRETFAGTSGAAPVGVTPASGAAHAAGGAAQPLTAVRYANLWPGINLVYDAPPGSLLRSNFTIAPGADPAQIRLSYNVPARLLQDGSLEFAFATGTLTASTPIAWQEIGGERVPVAAQFQVAQNSQTPLVSFRVGEYNPAYSLVIEPILVWTTFLGSSNQDSASSITVDGSGNVYVTGDSSATWGSPVNAFGGGNDTFVAKLDSSGALIWNTFLGGSSDTGTGIAVDGSGNVYVIGNSDATWGSPVNAFAGGSDAFVAKLDSSGAPQWNTFLGGSGFDNGYGIAVDGSGNIYVAGESDAAWGTKPINGYCAYDDAFVAELDNSGTLQWNTFLGGSDDDYAHNITIDGNGNIYVIGYSSATWGSPVNAFAGNFDAFVAKLDSSGATQWNTFLGGSGMTLGVGIALDGSGNIYVTGVSTASWGSPHNDYSGNYDAFVAKLDGSGALIWNTFLGSSSEDASYGIAVDGSGNVYVTGLSAATWGSPLNAFSGGNDAFLAKLDGSGALIWNTFLGGSGSDSGTGIAVDGSGNIFVSGDSDATWGSPLNAFAGGGDAFVARIYSPILVVQGNGQTIPSGDATPSIDDNTDFGTAAISGGTQTRTFTLLNTGQADLILTGSPRVELSGAQAGDFSIDVAPSSPIPAGGSTSFSVTFAPSALGPEQATVIIANDSDQKPYTFAIQGTGSSVPTLILQDATGLTTTSATLNGTINPNYVDATVTFEYGLTQSYGVSLAATPGTVSGGSATPVSASLSGLLPNTTYHYRLVASNADGTTYGDDQTFTTLQWYLFLPSVMR
jgi:hypothetical protein